MPYPILTNERTPAVADGKAEPRPNQSGSILLGWQEGRLFRYSTERGTALPSSLATRNGVVSSYDNTRESYDDPMMFADKTVDADGNPLPDYGPLTEPDTAAMIPSDKWWSSSDWTKGLIVHIYDSSASGSGASGQWSLIEGRLSNDPFAFKLVRPFAVDPAEGDKFRIGTLCWVVLAPSAAPLLTPVAGNYVSALKLVSGKMAIKILSGSPETRLEAYVSGGNWEINDPGYPFRPLAITPLGPVTIPNLRTYTVWNFGGPGASGGGTIGREVSLAFATVGEEDFKLDGIAAVFEGINL